MRIHAHFKQLTPSETLEQYTAQQLEAVSRLLHQEPTWHVFYSRNKFVDQVEITLVSGGASYKAISKGEDFYKCVDECATKIQKQVIKTKEKWTSSWAERREFKTYKKAS